ncbi:MAG: cytochrome c maturation protein CcmE [Candidatus Poseidoniales archaeon]|tara:strand:+ start:90 stop:497 length:408 start_codon:yes stop_codon:yes gene_type:complete
MDNQRRTNAPWSSWSKGLVAFSLLIVTGIVVSLSVTEQSTYVSVEEAISGKYSAGSSLQVHGTITNLKTNDCDLVDGNYSLRVDISSIMLPDTFAEDKGATFTGVLEMKDGILVLKADEVQMGCPSKYEPLEESA